MLLTLLVAAVFYGSAIGYVFAALGQALYEAAPSPKRFLRMEGVDHNNLTTDAEMNAIWSFIGADRPVGPER